MTDGRDREMILKVTFSLLLFSLLEQGVYGQCSTPPINLAVYEGIPNTVMNCNGPIKVSWFVYPTNDELFSGKITNFSDTVLAPFTNIYDVTQTNLNIRIDQSTAVLPNITTSGMYVAQNTTSGSNNKVGAKLVVVRQGPTCNCTPINSTNNNITCSVTYADASYNPIYAKVTWTADGAFYSSSIVNLRTRVNNAFTSTSTITTSIDDPRTYECNLIFIKPSTISIAYLATNAPDFTASCTAPCFPISMEPSKGPMAGGTNITIIGSVAIGYISQYAGSNRSITGVRNVYIGKDLSSTSVSSVPTDSSKFKLVAVTPNSTEASIGQLLLITIEFSPTPYNMTFNRAFTYLANPEITSLYPNTFIISGGTLLDVTGRSLSSVAKPIIQLTVIITRAAANNSSSTTSTSSTSRVCEVQPGNDTYMQCPMPPLNLPDDFLEVLNSQYNTNTSNSYIRLLRRRKRSINPSKLFTADSHSLLSRMKRDNSINCVLSVVGPNGTDRADICLGFIFDGYKAYENINYRLPDTKFIFYSAPEITSSNPLLEFNPSDEEFIYVKGRYMLRGCRLRDYVVHIDNQICVNGYLQDNQLSCRPPKEKPSKTINDSLHCDQHLSITITLGYKQYQYACLIYKDDHSATKTFALIVGLTVGLAGFALILTIAIACIVRRRRKKVSQETNRHQNSGRQEIRNPHYNTEVEPESQQDYTTRIYTRQNTISLYTPNDEYSTSIDEFHSNS